MDHGRGPRLRDDVEAVPEREKRVRGRRGAAELVAVLARPHHGEARRVDPAHLPGAHAQHLLLRRQHDRVRLDVLGHLPGEAKRAPLGGRRLAPAHHADGDRVEADQIRLLNQQSAGHAASLERRRAGGRPPDRNLEHAELPLGVSELLERVRLERRGEQDLDQDARQSLHQPPIHGPVDPDDPAVDRDGIGGARPLERRGHVRPHRRPAGVRVLDDDGGGLGELEEQAERPGEVQEVVVRELRPVKLTERAEAAGPERGAQRAVEGRSLMGILAVAERGHALRVQVDHRGKAEGVAGGRNRRGRGGPEPGGDRRVVLGRPPERLQRQPPACVHRHRAARPLQLLQDRRVLGRIDQHHDPLVVLRSRADHRRTAHVDLLDGVLEADSGLRGGRLERVEVHGHQIDRGDAVAREGLPVRREVTAGQDAPVDRRVECLHPPVEHLGEPRHVRDLADGQARCREGPGRAPGGQQLDAQIGQAAGQLHQPGLVGDGQERAANRAHARALTDTRRPATSRRPSA